MAVTCTMHCGNITDLVINLHIEDSKEQWPDVAAVVRRDIFVEDLCTSCTRESEAVTLRKDVTDHMAKEGFPMREWLPSSHGVFRMKSLS